MYASVKPSTLKVAELRSELKERGCSFVLFLLAVQVKARDVDVVQQLAVVFDLRRERTHSWSRTDRASSALQQDLANGPHRVAGRKEHDDFSFFLVLLQYQSHLRVFLHLQVAQEVSLG